jgi:predicted permease
VLFGLVPALQSSKTDLAGALRSGTAGAGRARSRTRAALLVAQVALSLVLLIGAGLLVRSLAKAQAVDLGIALDRLLYISVDLGDVGYSDAAQDAFRERAVERLAAMPGIARVSTANFAPLSGVGMTMGGLATPGRETLPEAEEGPYSVPVGPDYFQTTGTPLLRGRAFSAADREGSAPVMVVNQTLADLYWPAGDAVGACLTIGKGDETGPPPCTEVIGVTKDIRHRPLELAPPKYYVPLAQTKSSGRVIILRTRGEPQAMVEQVRGVVQNLAPGLPFVSVTPATEKVAPALRPFRLGAMLFSLFGALALLLAAVGLYGVVAFTVAQQTREIGVRIALGAATGDVLRLVIVRTMVFVLLGVAIGMAGALGVTRFMEGLLYGVETLDAPTFVAVPLLLLAVALLAAYLPARRATRMDPMVALRAE